MKKIKESIYQIIHEIDSRVSMDDIKKCNNLISELCFDSIMLMNLILQVEDKFSIVLEDDDYDLNIISDIPTLVDRLINKYNVEV